MRRAQRAEVRGARLQLALGRVALARDALERSVRFAQACSELAVLGQLRLGGRVALGHDLRELIARAPQLRRLVAQARGLGHGSRGAAHVGVSARAACLRRLRARELRGGLLARRAQRVLAGAQRGLQLLEPRVVGGQQRVRDARVQQPRRRVRVAGRRARRRRGPEGRGRRRQLRRELSAQTRNEVENMRFSLHFRRGCQLTRLRKNPLNPPSSVAYLRAASLLRHGLRGK